MTIHRTKVLKCCGEIQIQTNCVQRNKRHIENVLFQKSPDVQMTLWSILTTNIAYIILTAPQHQSYTHNFWRVAIITLFHLKKFNQRQKWKILIFIINPKNLYNKPQKSLIPLSVLSHQSHIKKCRCAIFLKERQ